MSNNVVVPERQSIYINSSQGRIFDFNTPSSRVYLGEAVNSLLRVFGNDNIIDGFRILDSVYEDNDFITITISPGEAIIDHTLVKYKDPISLSIDVSGYDEHNGYLVAHLFFNFVTTQQKNLSSIRLLYVTNSGNVPTAPWFTEYSNVIIAAFNFNKVDKTVYKRPIFVLNREVITISDKEYTIYPADNISKRILLYLNDTFN